MFPFLEAMTYPYPKTSVADETTHVERGIGGRREGPPFLPIEDRNIKNDIDRTQGDWGGFGKPCFIRMSTTSGWRVAVM